MSLKSIKIKSFVKNGILINNRDAINTAVKTFEGKHVNVIIEIQKKKRSNDQNAYLWGVCYELVRLGLKDMGELWSTNDVHIYFKDKFLKVRQPSGLDKVLSTTELSTVQFNEYVEQIQIFCAEHLGIIIPDPNEQINLNFDK